MLGALRTVCVSASLLFFFFLFFFFFGLLLVFFLPLSGIKRHVVEVSASEGKVKKKTNRYECVYIFIHEIIFFYFDGPFQRGQLSEKRFRAS